MRFARAAEAAEHYEVSSKTLSRWCERGLIQFKETPGGQRRYGIGDFKPKKQRICYCRVSSSKQHGDLERQKAQMRETYPDHDIIDDVGSGINFKRPGLLRILDAAAKGDVEEVVVAHRDRLARFGVELVEWILRTNDVKLVVLQRDLDPPSPECELADDSSEH
jgi:predicted site-specific integrase-resolvase